MRTVSWILLSVVSLLLLLGSVLSAGVAYLASPSNDIITGSTSLEDLTIEEDVATALRGRRGTAAAFCLAFTTLIAFIVLGPYRRGEVWSWWAILCSTLLLACLILLRLPTLGTSQGVSTGIAIFVVVLVALLLDVQRLTSRGTNR